MTLTVFTCEGCGEDYPSLEAAERCELEHEAEDRQERRRARGR